MAKGDRYVVLTMDKQTGNAGGLSAHIDREVYDAKTDRMVPFRPKSVRDDSRTALNRECIDAAKNVGRTQAIWNRLREEGFSRSTSDKEKTAGKKKTRKVKDDAVIALCFICSSDEDTMKQLESEGRLDEWIDSTIDWFRKEFGSENVVSAVLHMDETTPHLHVTVVPITHEAPKPRKEKPKFDESGKPIRQYETDKDGNIILDDKGRAIVKKRSYKKQEVAARLSAKDICTPVAMERWQTDYALAMAPFGLQRGIAGSKQKRVPPAEWNLQQVNGQLMAVEKEVEKQKATMKANEAKIESQKAEIDQMAHASLFDKMFNANLSPAVRKAFEEKDETHREEVRQARTAVDANGNPFAWTNGKRQGELLTWNEYARCLEKENRQVTAQAKADKDAAVAKVKKAAKEELDATIKEMKEVYGDVFERLSESTKENEALKERLKIVRDLILATFTLNFKKVAQIILNQCKQGLKQFKRDVKDFLLKSMSSAEKTVEGRRSYVNDAFDLVKIMAKTDIDCELDDDGLTPLHEDALRIADGTWDSYHQQRDQLFEAAVKAIVEMGNCSYQRRLNQAQANAIETFLDFDGGDRKQLCEEIWSEASPKIASCWRTGTHDALEELRKGELYAQGHRKGLSI